MGSKCLWAIIGAAVMAVVVTSSSGEMTKRAGRYPSQANSLNKFREYCSMMCGLGSMNCPFSCPESSLSLSSGFKRSGYRPFNDELGNLSFDDYIFLKMMGRTRK